MSIRTIRLNVVANGTTISLHACLGLRKVPVSIFLLVHLRLLSLLVAVGRVSILKPIRRRFRRFNSAVPIIELIGMFSPVLRRMRIGARRLLLPILRQRPRLQSINSGRRFKFNACMKGTLVVEPDILKSCVAILVSLALTAVCNVLSIWVAAKVLSSFLRSHKPKEAGWRHDAPG